MASVPLKGKTVMLYSNSHVFPLPFLSFLVCDYSKALSRLHQLKLLGHTLVVEFAKEQESAQVLSQPSVSDKRKRYVQNDFLMFVVNERGFWICDTLVILLAQRINCNHLKILTDRFRSIGK